MHIHLLFFYAFLFIPFVFLSCNKSFQPEVRYVPKLNVYAVLFANAHGVYVRVTPIVESPSDVSRPLRGATVTLTSPVGSTTMVDSVAVINGDTASFYYTRVHVVPGWLYTVSVAKEGYPPVTASAVVPYGFATVPEQSTHGDFRDPEEATSDLSIVASLSRLAAATFVQLDVEYRGIDSTGNFHGGSFNVVPVDSLNPFTEIGAAQLPVTVSISRYRDAFALAKQAGAKLRVSHLYVDIIVTQIDDNLYRFFVTSARMLDPLSMRTDKIIFTNVFNHGGTGIVSGASIDTTRIFLF